MANQTLDQRVSGQTARAGGDVGDTLRGVAGLPDRG